MQTKKSVSGRNTSREVASTRVPRTQKKAVENAKVEAKISELITSSARKQKYGTLPKKDEEPVSTLSSRCNLVHEETSHAFSLSYEKNGKHCNEEATECSLETIFSPAFHISKASGTDFARGGNFTQKSEIRDQKVQNYSQGDYPWIDADGDINKETFESSFRADEKHSDNSFALGNPACHIDVELHTDISYHCGDQILSMDTSDMNSSCIVDYDGTALSSEVSAIYLAMKNSKLECLDEHGQDSIPADVCLDDDDDDDDFEDFDPYLFIKNLPELSSVVPTFRPVLLPKQTRSCPPTTLVLDLDETLVHSTLEPCDDADFTFPVSFNLQEYTVYVRCRPYLRDFMDRVSILFEIIIFTASQSIYAEQLLNVLDPKRKVFRHRVYRESCVYVEGNYLKDLSVLGRDLAHVIIVDNSPQAFGFQVDNGIPIESWFDDRSDQELLLLIPFLESLVGVEDVRPLIARKYNLRAKIAAAVFPPLSSDRGDPFER